MVGERKQMPAGVVDYWFKFVQDRDDNGPADAFVLVVETSVLLRADEPGFDMDAFLELLGDCNLLASSNRAARIEYVPTGRGR